MFVLFFHRTGIGESNVFGVQMVDSGRPIYFSRTSAHHEAGSSWMGDAESPASDAEHCASVE